MIPRPRKQAKLWKATQPLLAILIGSIAAYSSAFEFSNNTLDFQSSPTGYESTPVSLYDKECSDEEPLFNTLSSVVKGTFWLPFSGEQDSLGIIAKSQDTTYPGTKQHSEMVQPESISLAAIVLLSLSLILGRSRSARTPSKRR